MSLSKRKNKYIKRVHILEREFRLVLRCFCDDEEQGATGPMAGIFGAVAQAMQGREYSPTDPERQIGDDIVAGVLAERGEDPTKSALAAIFGALGTGAGMDFIEALRAGDKPKPSTPKK